ncbi:Histone H1 [Musa troglodytarum]|uniref:Histone H1 n=1 Tax=Musa troglodytarum TaxID=320322 RepID=A0A9E7JVE1_9LILI|nr:Histone H1 [Musa troglodytarum]
MSAEEGAEVVVAAGAAPAVAEEPVAEAPVDPKPDGEKPVKEKKARAPKDPKEKRPKGSKPSTPSHPPYFEMIKEAILALNEKTGSSPYAIAKFMEEKHEGVLPPNYKKVLAVQLRNFTAKGKLVKVKASFKLAEVGKKDENKKQKKDDKKPVKETKKPNEAAKRTSKRTGVKKAKKAAAPKPKQPKSIRSPASKKARKTTA